MLADGFFRLARQGNGIQLFLRYQARPNASTGARWRNSSG